MQLLSRLLGTAAILMASPWLASGASAAESYDNCTGFIDSLPATIGTQGVWCLRKNLSTAMSSGNAITIATNNVTIDCNDFKIGGLAAGILSDTIGISGESRQNAVIRQCNIRGFLTGVRLSGSGHLVTDNRLDNNLAVGISVDGDNTVVRRNFVYDTGVVMPNTPTSHRIVGIHSSGDVIENTVSGLFSGERTAGFLLPRAIELVGTGGVARSNQIRNIQCAGMCDDIGVGDGAGIWVDGQYHLLEGNHIVVHDMHAIWTEGFNLDYCRNNTIPNGMPVCKDAGGNVN